MSIPLIYPIYQVKVAGHVVEQTMKSSEAHAAFKDARTLPVEMWRINEDASAVLVDRKTAFSPAAA